LSSYLVRMIHIWESNQEIGVFIGRNLWKATATSPKLPSIQKNWLALATSSKQYSWTRKQEWKHISSSSWHNSYFGPSTITQGSISFLNWSFEKKSLNFQNGRLGSQTLVLDSISSYNYEDDRFSPQTLHFRLNFIHKLSKCI
jgi:hypothetical protein